MLVLEQGLALLKPRLDGCLPSSHTPLLLERLAVHSRRLRSSWVLANREIVALYDVFWRISFKNVDKALVLEQSSFYFLVFLLIYHIANVFRDMELLRSKRLAHPVRWDRDRASCPEKVHKEKLWRFSVALPRGSIWSHALPTLRLLNLYLLVGLASLLAKLWLQPPMNDGGAFCTGI